MIKKLKKLTIGRAVSYSILIIWTILTIYPLYFTLVSSFKTQEDMFSNMFGFPTQFIMNNYIELFTQIKIHKYIFNSLFISVITVFIQVIIGAMAAFILSRFHFKYKKAITVFFMIGILIPMQAVMIPIALMAKNLGGYNSYTFIIACYITFGISYFVFVVTGFMNSIPREIEEAATIDGCGANSIFWRIILPLSIPALSTMSIISFFGAWNELILALVLLKRNAVKTISLGIVNFAGDQFVNYPGQCAAVIISIIPTLIIYLLLQENIIKGMTAGAVKG